MRRATGTADRPTCLVFADVADNPGRRRARQHHVDPGGVPRAPACRAALVGVIHDPALAAEAHRLGAGARFTARFNRDGGDEFSKPFSAPAVVRRLRDGTDARTARHLCQQHAGRSAPPRRCSLDGITVVVISNRFQCADPVFFEAFGLDIAAARVVVVKSRGHFRGGFDEFFRHEQVVEVDAPGLTSPILSRFPWKHMPRPVLPIDDSALDAGGRMNLADLPTPCLVLDRSILRRNIGADGACRWRAIGVPLRPHMKTAKSIDVARLATAGQPGGITVSTLAEAEYFAGHGMADILYAVGITPQKLDQIAKLNAAGAADHRASPTIWTPRARSPHMPAAAHADRDRHRRGPRRRRAGRRRAAGDRRSARAAAWPA